MATWELGAPPPPELAAALAGATLLVPAEGTGNVPQLAADLLIETARAPRVAALHTAALLPAAGAGAFRAAPGLALGLELYRRSDVGADGAAALFALQQRAPAAPGAQRAFAAELAAWAAAAGVARIVALGALDAGARRDAELAGAQVRYYAAAADGEAAGLAAACAAAGLPPLDAAVLDRPAAESRAPPWPLLAACVTHGVPAAALLAFVAEGDNVGDAEALAAAARGAVPGLADALGGAAWARPAAWCSLYGARAALT